VGKGSSAQNQQNQITQDILPIMQQEAGQSATLFGESNPGFQTAENYYQQLASGNQKQIFNAIAPAVGQINTASQGAAQNIAQNMPRGGAEQLAQAQNQNQRAGQIGSLATSAYTGSFPALAQLSGTGIGLSTNAASTAVSAGSAASSSNQALMQDMAANKGATMAFAGNVAGAGGQAAGGK
jgi:hypothetical protein